MRDYKEEYINYRIQKSEEAFVDAKYLASQKSWNACVNRLYYACYYIVSALALQNNIQTQTHSGLKAQFNLHFIKTNKVSVEMGKLYADLIDSRQKGDYGDLYDFDKETVEDLIEPVAEFVDTIKKLISQS